MPSYEITLKRKIVTNAYATVTIEAKSPADAKRIALARQEADDGASLDWDESDVEAGPIKVDSCEAA